MNLKLIFSLLVIFFLSTKASAQISRNFKKSVKPKYELGLGAILLDVPNYPGAKKSTPRVIPFPWIIYRGDFLQADEEGARAKFFQGESFELGFSGGFNFAIKSEDNAAREGMPDTDALVGFGPGLIYRFLEDDPLQRITLGIGLRLNVSTDLSHTFNYQGILLEPTLRYWRKMSLDSDITFFSSVSFSFSDQEYADFFYTVPKEFETAKRAEYKARGGLIDLAVSAGLSYDFSRKASFFLGAFYSNLTLAANKESYLLQEQHNTGLIMGFAWLFFESDTMVNQR